MKELIEIIQNQILDAEAFGIDEHNPHEAVNLSINQAKTLLQALTSVKSESAEEFEEALDKQLDALPYTKHLDDGQYNDGQVAGFERGARWCNDFANADKKQHAISFIKYIDIWHSNRKDISYNDLYEQYIKDYNEYLTTLNNPDKV